MHIREDLRKSSSTHTQDLMFSSGDNDVETYKCALQKKNTLEFYYVTTPLGGGKHRFHTCLKQDGGAMEDPVRLTYSFQSNAPSVTM